MDINVKIFMGLLTVGIIFIIIGLACLCYALLGKKGNERQKSHGPFGVFLLFVGLVLTLADTLTTNAFMAATFGLLLSIVVFHYGFISIRKKKSNKTPSQKSHSKNLPAA